MSASTIGTTSATAHPPLRRRVRRTIPTWWRELSAGSAWLLVLGVCALWVHGGGVRELGSLSGALMSIGRLTGLVASALLLIQVALMARIPLVEQAWGQDELTRMHRLVGLSSFVLMAAHVVVIWLGYAAGSALGLWGTLVDLVVDYPGMLLATAGTIALCLVVVTSLRAVRRRLRRESWHLLHLYAYLGAGLALPHQMWTGTDFLDSRAATVIWWAAWGASAGAVLVWRVAVPAWRSLRAPLRVLGVRADSPGATTVVVGGRGVRRLRVRGGQYLQWRFVDGPGWTRAHPFSLSARPDGRTLELTAAHVGDGTARIAELRPGARVLVEGPYGRLHDGARRTDRVLLLGGGIGMAPLKALMEDLGADVQEVTVIHRVRDADDALAAATQASAAAIGARHVQLRGRRIRSRPSWLPEAAAHLSDTDAMLRLVPDVAQRDVFVCGAPGWMDAVRATLREVGVPARQIHVEHFDI